MPVQKKFWNLLNVPRILDSKNHKHTDWYDENNHEMIQLHLYKFKPLHTKVALIGYD